MHHLSTKNNKEEFDERKGNDQKEEGEDRGEGGADLELADWILTKEEHLHILQNMVDFGARDGILKVEGELSVDGFHESIHEEVLEELREILKQSL